MPPTNRIIDEAQRFRDAVALFRREVEPRFSVLAFEVFLRIATQAGRTADEIAREVGLSQPGLHRVMGLLGDVGRTGEPGLGLVKGIPDPHEPRRLLFYLTAKGRQRMGQILAVLNDRRGYIEYPTLTADEAEATVRRTRSKPKTH